MMYGMEHMGKSEHSEHEERPKVLSKSQESVLNEGAAAIHRRTEVYKDELCDRGITEQNEIEELSRAFELQAEREFAMDLMGMENSHSETDINKEICEEKYLFGFKRQELEETNNDVGERLQECGVMNIQLEGVRERYQEMIANSVEEMCESYPELEGYVGTIKAADLPRGVFACAGPVMTENGYQTELQVSREVFGKSGLENRVERLELPNWRGESWLAGEGEEAVIKHELGHLLHLQMIAEQEGIELGSKDRSDFQRLSELYKRNNIATGICYEAMREQGIHPNELARNISVYGAHDMGECFAEAISEYETRKNPRPFAVAVHEKYERRAAKNDYTA